MKASLRTGIVAVAMTLAMLLTTAPAFAAGGGKGGGGGGGGGETVANNLSVPAILIGSGAPTLNFACGASVAPTGTPLTGYPIDTSAYYYVQGLNKWQASCMTATSATVNAEWGDNLTGDAKLKTNSPIRVEMGLLETVPTAMTGYTVDKLDPNALDRVSAYGTKALGPVATGFSGNPITPYPEVRVWTSGATLKIYNKVTGAVVFNGAATAEINSTGRIVYGYNLRVTTAGTYVIEFTAPNVSINSTDGGTISGNTVTLEIVVNSSAAGGGGKGHNR